MMAATKVGYKKNSIIPHKLKTSDKKVETEANPKLLNVASPLHALLRLPTIPSPDNAKKVIFALLI